MKGRLLAASCFPPQRRENLFCCSILLQFVPPYKNRAFLRVACVLCLFSRGLRVVQLWDGNCQRCRGHKVRLLVVLVDAHEVSGLLSAQAKPLSGVKPIEKSIVYLPFDYPNVFAFNRVNKFKSPWVCDLKIGYSFTHIAGRASDLHEICAVSDEVDSARFWRPLFWL